MANRILANRFLMNYILEPLERAARTFGQQFVVLLAATGSAGLLVHQNWLLATDSAGFAAITSLLTSVLLFKLGNSLLVRAAKTGLQSFVGTLTAAHVLSVAHADWRGALAVAVAAAVASLATASIPSFLPQGAVPARETGYEPGLVTDPSVELDEAGNPVSDDPAETHSIPVA